ncbi:RnaseH-domain-containing protein [Trametes coccinea BRFM310]|uniref:RnaseH-domain-containing protein n=1 Tax=Trametes coccinea (strain BRFM310) TaxID=1353009 RepID=A0A1Y2IZG5_TRAC3|nr:RnaseH-domain-containing protein [Trametes coccinea BRFM310]
MAHRRVPPFAPLHIVNGLTKHVEGWEQRGWVGISNARAFQEAIALLRSRSAPTTLRWVKGHKGTQGNEEADKLAGEGANMDRQYLPIALPPQNEYLRKGMLLSAATQRMLYWGIREQITVTARRTTATNVLAATKAAVAWGQHALEQGEVWRALRRDPVVKKTRDFLWKTLHGVYRVGRYWNNIQGHEARARCALCGDEDSMEHILQECSSMEVGLVWKLVSTALARAGVAVPAKPSFGLYMAAPALSVTGDGGKIKPGPTRLVRTVIPEAAHLVWKLRCRRVIEWAAQPLRRYSVAEVRNEWIAMLNKRVREEQLAAAAPFLKPNKITVGKIRETWTPLLDTSEVADESWAEDPGVLVGMSLAILCEP